MSKFPALMILLASLAPLAAHAQDAAEPEPRTGDETRAWMELQKSGVASVAAPRPMTGEVADKVYKRYVDSFGHPIPEAFQREKFTSDSK